jgi:hypothetical protein
LNISAKAAIPGMKSCINQQKNRKKYHARNAIRKKVKDCFRHSALQREAAAPADVHQVIVMYHIQAVALQVCAA